MINFTTLTDLKKLAELFEGIGTIEVDTTTILSLISAYEEMKENNDLLMKALVEFGSMDSDMTFIDKINNAAQVLRRVRTCLAEFNKMEKE